MKEIEQKLGALCATINENLKSNTKAAHARIRKATLELAKVGREYRKASVEADKA